MEKSAKAIALEEKFSPKELAKILSQYDVVSFDIFDTLIFRRLSCPDELFFLVGKKINAGEFAKIRIKAEEEARKKGEPTLLEIYEEMKSLAKCDKEKVMRIEEEAELEVCYANPYMAKVYDNLKQIGKKIIIISDMYLSRELLENLLENCGYAKFERLFVSCEYKTSKFSGGLYKLVKKEMGEQLSYIHIGDNHISDVKQAKKHCFKSVHYV